MTLFYFVVASFPFALYLLTLACIHSRAVPFVVGGRRDFIAMCLALSGVFFIGPGQLLVTWGAAAVWGKYVWALLAALCFLVVLLISSNMRPRIVVYNASRESLRKTLTTTAISLDDEACWSGSALNMPGLGVQFYLDAQGLGRAATIVRIDPGPSQEGWLRFARELKKAANSAERARGRATCAVFSILGLGLLIADAFCFLQRQDALREAFSFYMSV